jgi:hypothetical protein
MAFFQTIVEKILGSCITRDNEDDIDKCNIKECKEHKFNAIPPVPSMPPPPQPLITPSQTKKGKKSSQMYYARRQKAKEQKLKEDVLSTVQNDLDKVKKNRYMAQQELKLNYKVKKLTTSIQNRTSRDREYIDKRLNEVREKEDEMCKKTINVEMQKEMLDLREKNVSQQEKMFNEKVSNTLKDLKDGKITNGEKVELILSNECKEECPICYVNPCNATFHCTETTGHKVCYECALDIYNRDNRCPICRAPQEQHPIRIF